MVYVDSGRLEQAVLMAIKRSNNKTATSGKALLSLMLN